MGLWSSDLVEVGTLNTTKSKTSLSEKVIYKPVPQGKTTCNSLMFKWVIQNVSPYIFKIKTETVLCIWKLAVAR